jgi:hypothetical protein
VCVDVIQSHTVDAYYGSFLVSVLLNINKESRTEQVKVVVRINLSIIMIGRKCNVHVGENVVCN